jgi:hypothetical protein
LFRKRQPAMCAHGSVAVQFGGCDGKISNCLPTMAGWNYMVRLYRPRRSPERRMEFPRSAARELTSTAGSADCAGFGRHTTSAPFFSQTLAKGACIVGLIGEELPAERCAGELAGTTRMSATLPGLRQKANGRKVVDDGMDRGGLPSAGVTDRLYCALNARAGPAMRRRTVAIDILRRRAASEMLLASTTLAKSPASSGPSSSIPLMEMLFSVFPSNELQGNRLLLPGRYV